MGVAAGLAVLGGCAAPHDAKATASGPDGEDSTGSDPSNDSTGAHGSEGNTSGPVAGTSDGGESDSTGHSFLIPLDTPSIAIECSPWLQDCPAGEKCTAWVNDGGAAWNATKCVPIAANPGQPGDACTAEGVGSGFDDCDARSMCWDVDPSTNEGTCIAFCSGSEANPVCDEAMTSCIIVNDGALNLCLPDCNPLLQDCNAETQNCFPAPGGFACAPDVSGENGAYGDDCAAINTCDSGLYCEEAALVPGCTSAACCTTFCDLDEAGASEACPGAADGQSCEPWFDPGTAPPGLENLGSCVIPQ